MKYDYYPVIHPDGTYVKVEPTDDNDLYKKIGQHVGTPFDVAPLYEGTSAYVHDEGLFNGMEMNMPVAITFGLVICGPAMLIGPPDRNGNTTLPTLPEGGGEMLMEICERISYAWTQLEHMRAHPFQIVFMDSGDPS